MILTETSLIYKGIRPLQKLGALAFSSPLGGLAMPARIPERLAVVPPDPWTGDAERGRDMISGIFRFAGQSIERAQLSWQPAQAKAEWITALHSFEWLRDLRSVGGDRARRMAREMVSNWLNQYEKICPVAYRPDILGARISAWMSFHDFFCAAADDTFRKNYFTSLVRQSRYLSRHLPGNLKGLPLMRALKGLAYSGIALDDDRTRLDQAFTLIIQQIKEQLLPDGGHISRSPQATFEFMQCLVDLRTALSAARIEMPEEIQHAIDRVAPAVKFFRHGDGALCQFNGGQEGNAHICDATLMHSGARGRAMKSLPYAGYEKIQMGRASLIMDTGVPVISKYSNRAHAGLLSFEYSFGKDRVFVNCGTSAVKGTWRDLLRGTAAHTTITVDNRNACQFNDDGIVSTLPDIRAKVQETDDTSVIDASHTGYVPRHGLTHRRTVKLEKGGDLLTGEDQLLGKSGVSYAVRFHLHPSIEAVASDDGQMVTLTSVLGVVWEFTATEGVKLSIEESVYAGEGETPVKSQQIVMNGQTSVSPTTIAWKLLRTKP